MTFEFMFAFKASTTKPPTFCVILQATLLTVVVPVLPANVMGTFSPLVKSPVKGIIALRVYDRPGVNLTALSQQPLPGVLTFTVPTTATFFIRLTTSRSVL